MLYRFHLKHLYYRNIWKLSSREFISVDEFGNRKDHSFQQFQMFI